MTQVLDRCIDEGAARIQWTRRNAVAGAQSGPKARGIGIACTERGGGGGLGGASVKVNLDGSAHGLLLVHRYRHREPTTLAMIAAETLGMPLVDVPVGGG